MTVIAVNKTTDIFLETINDVLNKEYVDIIQCLEKTYLANCQDAAVAEESSEIKIIVDRAEKFAKNHQYYQLYNSVIEAFDKIQNFR